MKVVLKKKEDKKKIYALVILGVVAAYMVYTTFGGSDQAQAPTETAARATVPAPAPDATTSAAVPRRGITARGGGEFRPHVHSNRPEDRIDPNKIDPTLRLDLLAKVQNVTLEGGSRNLFQFGAAAPVVAVNKTPIPKVAKIPINGPVPAPLASAKPGPPPAPTAPPIPLKYYGFSNTKNEPRKKAFFLDGEDIIVAWEGDTVKSRYKIMHIGVNSIEMEDTQFKSRQTLPLEPEPAV